MLNKKALHFVKYNSMIKIMTETSPKTHTPKDYSFQTRQGLHSPFLASEEIILHPTGHVQTIATEGTRMQILYLSYQKGAQMINETVVN